MEPANLLYELKFWEQVFVEYIEGVGISLNNVA